MCHSTKHKVKLRLNPNSLFYPFPFIYPLGPQNKGACCNEVLLPFTVAAAIISTGCIRLFWWTIFKYNWQFQTIRLKNKCRHSENRSYGWIWDWPEMQKSCTLTVVRLDGGKWKKSHAMTMVYNIHIKSMPTNTQEDRKKQTLTMHVAGIQVQS